MTLLLAWGCGDDAAAPPDAPLDPSPLTLRVLSSRPDSVTAGDALVEVAFAAELDVTAMRVTAGGRDVTDAFGPTVDGRRIGLVEGLALGAVDLEATLPERTPARLAVTTYPVTGPVISGPHQLPFVCRTQDAMLGPASDADCSVATRFEYLYKTTAGNFLPLADPRQVPADAAQVKRADEVMIDYVVRVERGTINRAIYQITTLFDPTAPAWTARAPQPQWTGKLIYSFKGGCGVGHHQGVLNATDDLLGGVAPLGDAAVGAGFAIASASLNTLGVNCNDVVAAETAMMVKERFIERYGVPLYTMGWGGSGGSIQQHLIAENYPGILDGIVPSISYPDIISVYPDIMDCPLFLDYFANRAAGRFPDAADQTAVTGFATTGTCAGWNGLLGHLEDPTTGCDPAIAPALVYHPITNPTGVRCTLADHNVNLVGAKAATGFARSFYDNTGVQYGLAAVNAGTISPEQFVHLNETIGGYGADGVHPAPRSAADPEGLRAIYQGGRIVRGNLGLATTPIVDLRIETDALGDIHDRIRSFATRARLRRANGHADNQVMVITAYDAPLYSQGALGAIVILDSWLTALVADPRADRVEAIRATKPDVTDLCLLPGMDPIAETCDDELPIHKTPRMVAGAPLEGDVLKCQLRPPVAADYAVTFTPGEWARLTAAFPTGVCDYTRPGVEQAAASGTWQSFGPRL
ncbi:MAG: hypothetical protein H0T79_23030 [Deltaproteobacteria bacterium]|nr:hypothetical protein [Deltaproteobacteria bacterium]